MNSESGSMQRNSALDLLSIEAEAEDDGRATHLDGSAAPRPLHHASSDGGAAGGRPAENPGAPGDDPGQYGHLGHQRGLGAAGHRPAAGRLAGAGRQDPSGDLPGATLDALGNERTTETGWKLARRIYEAALRAGQGVPRGWLRADENLPEMGGPHHPEFRGGGPGDQHSDLQASDVTEDVLRLLARLEGNTGEEVIDATVRRQHRDRKALAREQRKKIALGHKAADHEQGQQMG